MSTAIGPAVADCYTLVPLDQPAELAGLIREFTRPDQSTGSAGHRRQ